MAGGLIAGIISGVVGLGLAVAAAIGLVNVANNQATTTNGHSDQPLIYYGSN